MRIIENLARPSARIALLSLALSTGVGPSLARAAEPFPGPVRARVVRVLDGDTLAAEALLWPGHILTVKIRLRGVDAPEIHARCQREREAAERARDVLAEIVGNDMISISNIAGAKYYGRVLADVTAGDGRPIAEELLVRHVVRPYGGGRREGWC